MRESIYTCVSKHIQTNKQTNVAINIDRLIDSIMISSPACGDDRRDEVGLATAMVSQLLEETMLSRTLIDPRVMLCVEPLRHVWTLHVDVLVLRAMGGSVVDYISVAILAALANTRIPKVVFRPIAEGLRADDGGAGDAGELEVDDRPEMGIPLPVADIPVCVSVGLIGGRAVSDMSADEEACADAIFTVGVTADGGCRAMVKRGRGALDIGVVPTLLMACQRAGKSLHTHLREFAAKEPESSLSTMDFSTNIAEANAAAMAAKAAIDKSSEE